MKRLGRSRVRPGKSGSSRGSGDNKVSLRSKTLGGNTLGHKTDVLRWAKMLSVHLCFQVFFCLAKEASLSLECRNVNVFFCVMTPGADNGTTKEGQCS